MTISRKHLLTATVVVVLLFAIAFPLGDDHHGIGAHHKVVADIGNGVFTAFLISAVLLVALLVAAAVQAVLRKRH
jgi:NADH:ubiquinone oxidoreductase subunit 6 (subunit J)